MLLVTRDVSRNIHRCELTHLDREPIDYATATAQHHAYRALLASLGHTVVSLPADDAYPDCVFIEDTAIVLPDVAIITRPGAESRRGETAVVADELRKHRRLAHIEAPATIDGGDVLVLDDRIYVGLSERTNDAALAQLRTLAQREVIPVGVHGCLHLKTAVTRVGSNELLVNRDWIDASAFDGWTLIDAEEPFGANALLIDSVVIYPAAFPRTRAALAARGFNVRTVDADELAKAEGGVTCCALLV